MNEVDVNSVNPPPEVHVARAFELIAVLAGKLMDAPMAAVAVRQNDGTWHNYCHGLDSQWSTQELPSSGIAVSASTAFFENQPHHGPDGIQFRAAVGLSAGLQKGAILVFDRVARTVTGEQLRLFESLRDMAADSLLHTHTTTPSDACFTLDLAGRFVSVHSGLDGYAPGELLGTEIFDLVPSAHRERMRDSLLAQLGAPAAGFELPLNLNPGQTALYRFQTQLIFDRGRPSAIKATCRDITSPTTQSVVTLEALAKFEARSRELTRFSENLRELYRLSIIPKTSIEETCREYLAAAGAIFRVSGGRIVTGRFQVSWNTESTPPLTVVASSPLMTAGRTLGVLEFLGEPPLSLSHQDQDLLELIGRAVSHELEADQLRRERDALSSHLAEQLRRDVLTGLSNRGALIEQFGPIRKSAVSQEYAFVFIDLDRFKQINDTLGHSMGDALLKAFAMRLTGLLKDGEFAARIGGDEFALMLKIDPGAEAGKRTRITEIVTRIREPYLVQGRELYVTASIGVSYFPRDGVKADLLLQCADAAMYRAKGSGRDSVEEYRPSVSGDTDNPLEFEAELRRAVMHGELTTRFQPIVDLGGGLDSLEVLLAWQNPKLGKVGPARFIPVAEETGMIVGIGEWVLEQACAHAIGWMKSGFAPVRVAVNVSALQFGRADFVDMVRRALERSALPPQCLELELTESLVMRDVEATVRRMKRLRELGVSLSIDDFGTGYSSLNYLRQLPVHNLKIDRSFLAEMSSLSTSVPLIQTIVVLAHNLGLSVVAEGVETAEQLEWLRSIGCDKVQGHFLGYPMPADAVPTRLRRISSS